MDQKHAMLYAVLVILNAGLTQFAIELASGNVPIPHEWQWTIPILVAVLTASTSLLPSVRDREGKDLDLYR